MSGHGLEINNRIKFIAALALTSTINTQALAAPQGIETIGSSQSPSVALIQYSNPEAHVQVSYPRTWKLSLHPDKDTPFKITNPSGGDIAFGINNDPQITPDKLAKLLPTIVFSQLQDFKLLAERKIYLGLSRTIEGTVLDVSFDMNGFPVQQRYVLFNNAGRTASVTYTNAASLFNNSLPAVNDFLLSIRPSESAATGSVNQQPVSAFDYYHSPSIPLAFAYPSGWQITETSEPDHPVQIQGTDSAHHTGAITIFTGVLHPNAGLEESFSALEERYFKSKPGYRQVHQESMSFGSGNKIDGIIHESIYQDHGMPTQLHSAFFKDKNNNAYMFALVTYIWKDSDANSLFRKVLATVRLEP
jgi:hypothetical protein